MYGLLLNIKTLFSGTWILFISLLLMVLGGGLQGSLLGIRGTDEGFSTLTLSLISSGFYVGYFFGSVVVPMWLKQVGYIRVFAALVAVASVAAVAYAMLIEEYVWLAMRVLTGFCFAGIFMICESWLNSQTHNENRAKVLALYVIVIFVGMTVGQLLLNLGDISGYFLFALASVIISLASVPLLLTNRPVPVIEETGSLGILQLFRRSPLGAVASFLTNFLNGGIVGMSAIYAKTVGMPTDKIALFVGAAFVGVIVFQFPVGFISDRVDRRKVIICLSALSAVVAVMAMQTDDTYGLIGLFGLLGGLSLPLYAVCIAYVNDRLAPEEVLPATSALLKIAGVGNMIAPILIGYIMVEYGVVWFFGVLSIAATGISVFGVYRIIKGRDIDVEEQGDYAPIGVSTTAVTMSLATEGVQLEFDFGEQHRKPIESEEADIEPA